MTKKAKIFTISLLSIILLLLLTFIALNQNIIIELKGEKEIFLPLKEEYTEPGAIAKRCNIFKCHNIDDIEIENNIDNEKTAEYTVTYTAKSLNKIKKVTRKVTVIDTINPIIELSGEKSITICPSENYQEDGYNAQDNYDGDITDKVTIKEENNLIEYSVTDSSNNQAKETREINKIDEINPTISIKGNKTITIEPGTNYVDQGATVFDNCDGDITSRLETSSNVNPDVEGKYTVFYKVKDSSGNTSTANRTVIVKTSIAKLMNDATDLNEYIRYLEQYIKEKNYNVSIGYVNLRTGYTYKYNEGTVYYGASLAKTVTAMYLTENNLLNENSRPRVKKAIEISDNNSYISLLEEYGKDNIRIYGQNLGANIFLNRGDAYGNTNINNQIAIWKHLYSLINNHPNGQELKQYFINTYSNKLLFPGSPTTMHKYGYYGIYYHEAGIVFSNNPYIVVILTKHGNNNFSGVVTDLSSKIYKLNTLNY